MTEISPRCGCQNRQAGRNQNGNSHLNFAELGLLEPILQAVTAAGYTSPTPIQAQAIPVVLSGRDLLGTAQTGTGKTAAFALPIIHQLLEKGICRSLSDAPATPVQEPPRDSGPGAKPFRRDGRFHPGDRRTDWRQIERPRQRMTFRPVRVLVLSPTRELALQIGNSFDTYSKHTDMRHATIFGGVNQYHQVKSLRQGVDVLVATPGRLEDLHEQGHLDLSQVEVLVLDEADRMLDMGFMPALQRIIGLIPVKRQTLFFSATMPDEVRALSESILSDPVQLAIAPEAPAAETVEQCVYLLEKAHKTRLLRHFLCRPDVSRSIVFTRTKHGADRLERVLIKSGFRAEAIHSNRTQAQRQKALAAFKRGFAQVLIATDIASRGIDVDGVTHVFNFDLPEEGESYVHRIGRTGRAGASGLAIAFCSPDERGKLRTIERVLGRRIERAALPEQLLELPHHDGPNEQAMNDRDVPDNDRGPGSQRHGQQRDYERRDRNERQPAPRREFRERPPRNGGGYRGETGRPNQERRQVQDGPARRQDDQQQEGAPARRRNESALPAGTQQSRPPRRRQSDDAQQQQGQQSQGRRYPPQPQDRQDNGESRPPRRPPVTQDGPAPQDQRPPKKRKPPVVTVERTVAAELPTGEPELQGTTASGRPVYLGHVVHPAGRKRYRRPY
jgi:ATP-dependent RNA helicase RhlE